jgi:Bacterial PH domain
MAAAAGFCMYVRYLLPMSADNRATHSATEAGSAAGSRAVFRHRAMTIGFAVGTALLCLLIALAWSQPSAGNIVGTAVLAAGLWFIWASGWWTKVVVSENGVEIDNVFFQHVIPWRVFVDFSVDGGLVARLSDGTRVPVVSFGGSLAGAVTQYRGMSKKRDAMMTACRGYRTAGESAPGGGGYRRLVRPHWVALLMYVLPLVGIAVAIDASHHGL